MNITLWPLVSYQDMNDLFLHASIISQGVPQYVLSKNGRFFQSQTVELTMFNFALLLHDRVLGNPVYIIC